MSHAKRVEDAKKAVRAFFHEKMDKRTRKLLSAALMDLYEGPSAVHGIRGYTYTKALKHLREWWDAHGGGTAWYDIQSGHVSQYQPEGWTDEETGEYVEPIWSDYFEFDSYDLKRIVFGALVTDGGF